MFPSVSGVADAGRPAVAQREPRVFVTGVADGAALELVTHLVDAGCAVLIQQPEPCKAVDAEVVRLVRDGGLVASHIGGFETVPEAMRLTANAAMAQGSLDLVVNFISVDADVLADALNESGGDAIDDVIAGPIEAALAATAVAANRMGLTWRNGLVVNVLSLDGEAGPARDLLASLMRSAFAGCTRNAAAHWSERDVRINAICASSGAMPEADTLLSLVMHLKGGDASDLTGCVFDTDLAPTRC